MANVNIDGVDFDVNEQAAQAVKKVQRRLVDAEEEIAKKKEKEDEEEKKKEDEEEGMKKDHQVALDSLQAKHDDAVAKVPTPEMLDALVEKRTATLDVAKALLPKLDWVGKDCETIRKEVVADRCPEVEIDKVSVDYIKARFDALAPAKGKNVSALDAALGHQVRGHVKPVRAKTVSNDARDKFSEQSRNLWKKKEGGNA